MNSAVRFARLKNKKATREGGFIVFVSRTKQIFKVNFVLIPIQ